MNKKLIILFFIVIVIALIFFISRGGGSEETSSPLQSEGVSVSLGSNPNDGPLVVSEVQLSEFATLLSVLQSVQIDTSMFSKKTFTSLRDNSVNLGDVKVKRANPFAQLGQDVGGINLSQLSSQALTIETVQPDPRTITTVSAELSAYVEFEGSIPVDVLFQYKSQNGELRTTPSVRVTTPGFVKTTVTNLEKGQTYTFSSLGTRETNTQSGSTMSFTTKAQ